MEVCLIALVIGQLPIPVQADASGRVDDEILGASPLEIWREFLRQEEETAALTETTRDTIADPVPAPDPAPAIIPPTLAPAPVSMTTGPFIKPDVYSRPVSQPPRVAVQGIAVTPDAAHPGLYAPEGDMNVTAAAPRTTDISASTWSPMVVVDQVITAITPTHTPLPAIRDHSGWVTYLRGAPTREVDAPHEAKVLHRTRTKIEALDHALGIQPVAEPLFATLETILPPAPDRPQEAPSTFTGPMMSLNDLTDQVLSDDLEIRIRKARTLERGYNVQLARAGGRPTISLNASTGPNLDFLSEDESMLNGIGKVDLTVDYNLFDFGSNRYEVLQAQRSLDSATAETEHKANEKVYEVLETLLRGGQASEATTANESHLERLEELRALIQINVNGGNGTAVDVRRVDSRIEATQSGLIALRSQRANAVSGFRRLTGLEADSIDFAGLYRNFGEVGAFGTTDILVNPEIRASNAEIAALSAQEEAVRRSRLPSLSIQSGAKYESEDMFGDDEDTLSAEVSLRLSFDLYDGGASTGRQGQLRAQRAEAELRRLRKLREIEEEAENIATFSESQNQKRAVLEDRVGSLENVASLYREQFGIGARTVFEMLESEADLLAARIELSAHMHERTRSFLQKLRLQGDLIDHDWS